MFTRGKLFFMKEYIVIIIAIVGFFLLNRVFSKYKNARYRFISSVAGIIVFAAIFIVELIKKKAVIDNHMIVSFLLVLALIIYLLAEVLKNYKELNKK
jgi:hypothetical protein